MSLQEQIQNDLRQAQKEKNEAVVCTLRMLLAALKNAEIAKMREALSEDEVQKLIKTEIKKRKEAIEDYKRGGRDDLANKEAEEVKILEKYQLRQLSEDDIKRIVQKVIAEVKPAGAKDPSAVLRASFGRVMGQAMKEAAGRADGAVVGKILKEEMDKI
jgi:uncharacterized protein YqeY